MNRREFLRYSACLAAAGVAHRSRVADRKKPARVGYYQRVYDEQCKKNRARLDAMAARGGVSDGPGKQRPTGTPTWRTT